MGESRRINRSGEAALTMLFRFANSAALLLLVLPLVIWLIYRLLGSQNQPPSLRFSSTVFMQTEVAASWRTRWAWLPNALRLIAWGLLVVAIARPQSGNQQEVIRGQGIDIVLALDISTSMNAEDILPSRLEAAKAQIERFIEGRRFDRVGMVVFAADAFHYVPPTLDYEVLTNRLREVLPITEYGLPNADGTAIGTGIASAANMLRESRADSKVIVLLTDGSNNTGSVNPLDAARATAALGIRVYTIGMGRAGRGGEFEFDETSLQQIAQIADGLYFRVEDVLGLQRTYEQIDALERSDIEQQVFVRWREQAGWVMVAALLSLLLERTLRLTVFLRLP